MHHALGLAPDYFSLVALRGYGVNLGARLSVGCQQIVAHDGAQKALAVLLAHNEKDFPILPEAVLVHKAEGRSKQRLFPELQLHQLPAVLAL